MIVTILLGLTGFGIVVFVHELGHFLAAKAVGVSVETFSLGWGPRIAGFKRGGTDYRLSLFPIGGFCAMKGDDELKRGMESGNEEIIREKGSYYGVSPMRRIIIAIAGPAFNLIFAITVFSAVYLTGIQYSTTDSRLVLASDFQDKTAGELSPAEAGGLRSGDLVTAIDGKKIDNYTDLQQIVAMNAGTTLRFSVERDGINHALSITPKLDKQTGAGRIGVYSWITPVVNSILPGSPASLTDIRPGDTILAIDGNPIRHARELDYYLENAGKEVRVLFLRDGVELEERVALREKSRSGYDLGIFFKARIVIDQEKNVFSAFARGFSETGKTFALTLKGLSTLFSGVDILSAVSGPARITVMVGEVATQGFSGGIVNGLTSVFNFLAFLSIVLFIMNLLPIPMLDGGQVMLFLGEIIRRKPFRLRTMFRYQMVGVVIVFGLFSLSMLADFLFFMKQ